MSSSPSETGRLVCVTGATGYIGGRLVSRLLDAGHRVRCFVRSPRKLSAPSWAKDPRVEIIGGDLSDLDATRGALRGCSAAYYLVHSMAASGSSYRSRDRELAQTFATAAADESLERIVYLGGLGETGDGLSEHLASRREVEELLASGPVPVTVLRAAMIIGSGSASFEIMRYLVERLPIMVTPRWVRTPCQPIAVGDVLRYLVRCLDVQETVGQTLDIGGPDVLDYQEFMHVMAEARSLPRRIVLPVPLLTPHLSSLWIHLVTPLSKHIARPLAEGLRNPVVCRDHRAQELMPQQLTPVRQAVAEAVANLESDDVETAWSDAGPMPGDPDWSGGRVFVDRRSVEIQAAPELVYRAVCRIGGKHGYYRGDWLWRLRGALDRLIGGPGLRRGRRHPDTLGYGDALDFWRITDATEPKRLALRAEMKLPGEALLEFEIEERSDRRSVLVQTARFIPRGLLGLAYWYAVVPLHAYVFRGMLDGFRRDAERLAAD